MIKGILLDAFYIGKRERLNRGENMRPLVIVGFCLLCVWCYPSSSHAYCVDPPGDVTGDGQTDVSDVQCVIVSIFFSLGGGSGSGPQCVSPNLGATDLDCTGEPTVTDALLLIHLALGGFFSPDIDTNGNLCVDACELDCAGVPGGAATEDMCEVCDGDPSNDCVQDCAGQWGGSDVDDCAGGCGSPNWVGDGNCDDGSGTALNFDCEAFSFDGGDCATTSGGGCLLGDVNGDGFPDDIGRHWRVLQNSFGASNWFVAELEFAENPDGADTTDLGGTASAARVVEGSSAMLAFDNNANPGSSWGLWYAAICCAPVPVGTDWLAWDFGGGNQKFIQEIRIKQFDDPAWMYNSLIVQTSCDGENWMDVWTADGLTEDGEWNTSTFDGDGGGSEPGGEVGPCEGNLSYLGDGWCDGVNNNVACDYDGGDCCASTCEGGGLFPCGQNDFDCQDEQACENDPAGCGGGGPDPSACNGNPSWLGDGYCDGVNNNMDCAYDGGDCCASTCVDGPNYSCGSPAFDCLDPAACENNPGECGTPPGPDPDGKSCVPVGTLQCGQTLEATTVSSSAVENIILYSCSTWWESGPELAYVFEPTQTQEVTAILQPTTGVNNLDLFLLEDQGLGCHADSCLAKELFSEITWIAEAGTTYYVVVDGFSEASGPFELSLDCGQN